MKLTFSFGEGAVYEIIEQRMWSPLPPAWHPGFVLLTWSGLLYSVDISTCNFYDTARLDRGVKRQQYFAVWLLHTGKSRSSSRSPISQICVSKWSIGTNIEDYKPMKILIRKRYTMFVISVGRVGRTTGELQTSRRKIWTLVLLSISISYRSKLKVHLRLLILGRPCFHFPSQHFSPEKHVFPSIILHSRLLERFSPAHTKFVCKWGPKWTR
jgi:hypothetical protein